MLVSRSSCLLSSFFNMFYDVSYLKKLLYCVHKNTSSLSLETKHLFWYSLIYFSRFLDFFTFVEVQSKMMRSFSNRQWIAFSSTSSSMSYKIMLHISWSLATKYHMSYFTCQIWHQKNYVELANYFVSFWVVPGIFFASEWVARGNNCLVDMNIHDDFLTNYVGKCFVVIPVQNCLRYIFQKKTAIGDTTFTELVYT